MPASPRLFSIPQFDKEDYQTLQWCRGKLDHLMGSTVPGPITTQREVLTLAIRLLRLALENNLDPAFMRAKGQDEVAVFLLKQMRGE